MKRATGNIDIHIHNKGRLWMRLKGVNLDANKYAIPEGAARIAKENLHVTIVRNEKPLLMDHLPVRGKTVSFEYDDEQVKDNGHKYWLVVKCPELANIRDRLGLRKQPTFPFHVTIGEKL